jgi:hypothetical protein
MRCVPTPTLPLWRPMARTAIGGESVRPAPATGESSTVTAQNQTGSYAERGALAAIEHKANTPKVQHCQS